MALRSRLCGQRNEINRIIETKLLQIRTQHCLLESSGEVANLVSLVSGNLQPVALTHKHLFHCDSSSISKLVIPL